MDAETLEALKGSIAKWEAIVAGTGKNEGPLNCPLCRKFHAEFRNDSGVCCAGCPVADAGFICCAGSPYDDYENASRGSSEKSAAAVAELEVLKSLLPPEAQ